MTESTDQEWTEIYETASQTDAELVRTTLEVAGYRVYLSGGSSVGPIRLAGTPITVAVPTEDADEARAFLKEKTSLLPSAPPSSEEPRGEGSEPPGHDVSTETIEDAASEVLDLRRQREVAACKYCGIPTLDISELDLASHAIALLRAAGLGVNSATYSEFQASERICTECAAHEVACDLCGRTLDGFIDEGEYVRSKDDEAYVCNPCRDRLEGQLDDTRDW